MIQIWRLIYEEPRRPRQRRPDSRMVYALGDCYTEADRKARQNPRWNQWFVQADDVELVEFEAVGDSVPGPS